MASAVELIREGVDVNIQDQTTPDVILKANRVLSAFTLDGIVTRGLFTASVVAGHTAVAGDWVCIQEVDTDFNLLRFYQAQIVVAGATQFEMDRPFDYAFDPAKVACTSVIRVNLANEVGTIVDPVIYRIRPTFGAWDITRMMIQIFSSGTQDDGQFGPITSLPHGITVRRNNDFWYNSLNWKNNGDMAAQCFDTDYADKPPAGTGNGWTARLTWAGKSKIGVAKRLESAERKGAGDDDELQVILPDSLAAFGVDDTVLITFEGHIVDEDII